MKREIAWRVFADEFNDATLEIKGSREKEPSYVITPLGAKINRVFIVGVLTDVENISEEGELIRAHISDPTGVFTLYSGRYQPEVTKKLSEIDVPAFVALTGKSRTFEPEKGVMYVSIRPETVSEVDEKTRNIHILETCKHTLERIEAMREALQLSQPNVYDLQKLGYHKDLCDGVINAVKHYRNVDLQKYIEMVSEALNYLIPLEEEIPEVEKVEIKEKEEDEKTVPDDIENMVLEIIKNLENENDGAPWDMIIERCNEAGIDKDLAEEALTSLMDKGIVFEPTLGIIKTT
ncbi:MAG TPA: hypothetical protein ENI36_01065 [Thermoplasmatales archaeon]|nr:hypothetical protein [Thermoplasmatales archaeon]